MQIEQQLQVSDVREAYLRWNAYQYELLNDVIEGGAHGLIKLIPLFLQLNDRMLPGYTGPEVPVGVYGYKPDKNTLKEARALNNRFRYQQEGVIRNAAIDAVVFQRQLIDGNQTCWIFLSSNLTKDQSSALIEKIKKISQWLSVRGISIDIVCTSVDDFQSDIERTKGENQSLFLDNFYSETVLLAGKYAVWWLVPPSSEKDYTAFVEHIKQARYVDNDEFIDLGSTANLNRSDLVKSSVDQVQMIKQSAEVCLIKLLLLDQKNSAWPGIDGVSIRLKNMLYQGQQNISPVEIVAEILHDALSQYAETDHVFSPVRLFSNLKSIPGKLNKEILNAFLGEAYFQELAVTGIENIIVYLNLFKAVSYEIRQIFSNIITRYNAETDVSELNQSLASTTRNMLVFLSENADRVPLYNNKDKVDIILDRILLRHEIVNETEERWSLVLEAGKEQEKTIEGFSSLLGLLAWCWLNRVVNHSTQVSIDCPKQLVKQTEARYVLEVLIQQLNPKLIAAIPPEAFENPVRPLQSLLFVNLMTKSQLDVQITANDDPLSFGQQSENLVTHCEQLVINSWGDVYTKQYSGNTGILKCLCDWTHHAPLDSLSRPQQIKTFGHGTGDSTYISQRIDQVYAEMLEFFYQSRPENGRFILRLGVDYYAVTPEDALLEPVKIGNQKLLMDYLEAPVEVFQETALERLAYTEEPIKEVYQRNKENVVQVFFKVVNRNYYTWVLDEKGSLWTDITSVNDRESYIMHWLYLFRNIRNRLKKINYQDRELPTLEIKQISFNQLGGIEFYTVGSEALSGNKSFLDLQVSIAGHREGDQLSLVCDGRQFNYQDLKQNVLIECVQYISARQTGEGRRPVYITDIDVPLRLFNVTQRDDIQISHILKFKRNFERRINKLLYS